MSTRTNLLLNIATGTVTVMALVIGAARIRQMVSPAVATAATATKTVSNWRTYSVGQRIGPTNAPVTIVEFSDFQCPYCAKAAAELSEIRARYPNEVAIVYRHYPLDFHPFAVAAAHASECAGAAGTFARYHDLLFAEQGTIGKTSWSDFAVRSGVRDTTAFNRCMSDTTESRLIIQRDQAAGRQLGVRGTPSFLINESQISGVPGKGALEAHVLAALKGARR